MAKKKVGRPTKITKPVVSKLEAIFKMGAKPGEACRYAKISTSAFYRAMKENEEFRDKMESAKDFPNVASKKAIIDAITQGETKEAMWWLEKRDSDFKEKQELEVSGEVEVKGGEETARLTAKILRRNYPEVLKELEDEKDASADS